MTRPNDPVIDFILDPSVRTLIKQGSDNWPWSRLSASRIEKIGYRLIVLRCAQMGFDAPSRIEAAEWARG